MGKLPFTQEFDTEVQLKSREAQLALVYDTVGDIIFVLSVTDSGRFIFSSVNKRFLEATGLREDQVAGRYVEDVIPAPAHALVLGKYREAMRTGKPVSWEETSVYPAGEKVGEVTVAPVIVDGAPCRQLIGTVHDITEHRRMHALLEKNEERWRLALEGSGAGVWDWDIATNTVAYSPYWKKLIGHEEDAIPNEYREWEDRIHPEDKAGILASVRLALKERRPALHNEHRLRHKDGHWIWVQAHALISYNGAGTAERMIGTIVDITSQREAEAASRLAALVYKNSSEAMAVTDAAGIILAINDAFARAHNVEAAQVIGTPLLSCFSGVDDSGFQNGVPANLSDLSLGGTWQGEVWRRNAGNDLIAELCTVDTIFYPDHTVYRHIYLFLDITERKKSEEVIWRQANFDALTQLPNRHQFADRLKRCIETATRHPSGVALLLIDLDRFKEVNDGLGHSLGDLLLVEATRRLRQCLRGADFVARLGGDEFAVILDNGVDAPAIDAAAQAVLHALSQPFDIDGNVIFLSASIGSAHYPRDAPDAEALIKYADQAMYAAKSQGGNRHSHFDVSMEDSIIARRKMVNDMHAALPARQFRMVYQPIVDLASQTRLKAEALIRWTHPEKGEISPGDFIPLAEDIGMIEAIGNWSFDEAIRQCAPLCRELPFELGINVSPVQFRGAGGSLPALRKAIERHRIAPSSIVVEVTENVLLSLDERMEKHFAQLSAMGIRFALDDFGTGYSSLSYITRLKFDYLKIDRVFVHNLEGSPTKLALCETIISMAHKLGMKVIAEGIESAEQCRILTDAGCDFGQGFYFARPMSLDHFAAFVRAYRTGMPGSHDRQG